MPCENTVRHYSERHDETQVEFVGVSGNSPGISIWYLVTADVMLLYKLALCVTLICNPKSCAVRHKH